MDILRAPVNRQPRRVADVLRRIDLRIASGEFVMTMGPSGAGKPTLLGVLGMLDTEWPGQYCFKGERVDALSAKKRGS